MWLKSGDQLVRLLVIGLPVYLAVILLLRVVGTRALSRNNAFDTVVSFALGSVLAAAIITPELPGALGLGAVLLLLTGQYVLSWLAVRLPLVKHLTRSSPRLILHEGAFRDDVLRKVRLTRGSVRAAIRAQGIARLENVFAVVLETDGSLSVVPRGGAAPATALEGVDGFE
jgi:uncharacterized membrane protein YcaP (DUF421 family)